MALKGVFVDFEFDLLHLGLDCYIVCNSAAHLRYTGNSRLLNGRCELHKAQ